MLQLAISFAGLGERDRPDLKSERIAAGEPDGALDAVIAGVGPASPGPYGVPQAESLATRIETALREGLADAQAVARMTSGARSDADSLHVLVMDMHTALNALQASIASENIDGARVYGINAEDRARIAAFMRGVNSTRALKFDHPGLATTATRAGERLVLQNDIGTTDAHVLVVHVENLAATVTYTDVHLPRLIFFQEMLARWKVKWNDTRSRSDAAFEDGVYHLAVGSFRAATLEELDAYLAALGSRLVFLIDWNRARKRLRLLVAKREVGKLLAWAAENGVGHMAFLRMGGEQAVFDALASLGKAPASFGARLEDLLGRKGAIEFLRFALRSSAELLMAGKPASLVLDGLRGELFGYFHSAQQTVLDHASEQVALAIEMASGVRDCLLAVRLSGAEARFAHNAQRAKLWERRADDLVNLVRELAQRSDQAASVCALIEATDDVADELEDAAFHLTLLAGEIPPDAVFEPLTGLAGLLVEGTQEYLKAIEAARVVRRGVPRADVQDFFEAIHRIVRIEQQSDEIHRTVKASLLDGACGTRVLFALGELSRNLEASADALMHSALTLRDYVLKDVMAA